jgi:calcineurin-like phosphoesterase family protein
MKDKTMIVDIKHYVDRRKVLFTADEHYGSERHLFLNKRPFSTVAEADETMVNRFNQIADDDTLTFHIGDFGDFEMVELLKGQHILICGNYDDEVKGTAVKGFVGLATGQYCFNQVDTNTLFGFIGLVNLVHKPIDCVMTANGDVVCNESRRPASQPFVCEFDSLRDSITNPVYNIFGHIHGLRKITKYGLNVGVDANNYSPVTCDIVEFYLNALINHKYDENVFI